MGGNTGLQVMGAGHCLPARGPAQWGREGQAGRWAAQALTSRQQAEAGSPGSSWSFQNGTAVAQGETASVKGELEADTLARQAGGRAKQQSVRGL